MRNNKHNKKRAAVLAEAAAAIAIMVPLMMLFIFVVLEMSQAYFLKASLAQGARQAARQLAIAYGRDPSIAQNRSAQASLVLDQIRLNAVINDSQQFDQVTFQTAQIPHTVTVKVRYASGLYGLPIFPHPDPLNLSRAFTVSAESTYRLE